MGHRVGKMQLCIYIYIYVYRHLGLDKGCSFSTNLHRRFRSLRKIGRKSGQCVWGGGGLSFSCTTLLFISTRIRASIPFSPNHHTT